MSRKRKKWFDDVWRSATRFLPISNGLSLFRGAFTDLTHRPPNNVAALDVLRSLAILLVFSGHTSGLFRAPKWSGKLFYFGWTGVDLFFVLSGLLIGSQLWKEVQRTGHVRIGRFLLRRGLRIWPLYFAFVALILVEIAFSIRPGHGIFADITFCSNYYPGLISGGWSLSTEEQFYVVAPVSLSLVALALNRRYLWVLPLFALIIPIAARALAMISSRLPEAELRERLYLPIHTHSDGLAIGVLLAWIVVYRPDVVRSRDLRLAVCGLMLVVGAGLYVAGRVLFNFTVLALIYGAATFYGLSLATTPKILKWRGFYVISRLSYGIYLNHLGILSRLGPILGPLRQKGGAPGFWLCYLISLLVCIAFAAVTFQLIEWPFLQIRARWGAVSSRAPFLGSRQQGGILTPVRPYNE